MNAAAAALRMLKPLLDFALPPRCGGCGAIVDSVDSFCAECWKTIEFLGAGGCTVCGLPLEGTDIEQCARCLARPPRIARTRAAVAYGELARSVAIRLTSACLRSLSSGCSRATPGFQLPALWRSCVPPRPRPADRTS